jgi:hypothetical protein
METVLSTPQSSVRQHVDRLGELLQAENENMQNINSYMLDESLA